MYCIDTCSIGNSLDSSFDRESITKLEFNNIGMCHKTKYLGTILF